MNRWRSKAQEVISAAHGELGCNAAEEH
jgi:hypothetical protein